MQCSEELRAGKSVWYKGLVVPTFRREVVVDRQPHRVGTAQVVLKSAEACILKDPGPRASLSFHVRVIHELGGASAGPARLSQPPSPACVTLGKLFYPLQ